MPRVPRCQLPDGLFHVGARGVAKTEIFRDDADRRRFLELVATAAEKFDWDCQAFCLMTTHYHLVLESTQQNLSDGFRLLNGDYAQGFNWKYLRCGHLFGDRFWSRPFGEADLERICEYVMMNPVRVGLCRRYTDWRWSACRFVLDV